MADEQIAGPSHRTMESEVEMDDDIEEIPVLSQSVFWLPTLGLKILEARNGEPSPLDVHLVIQAVCKRLAILDVADWKNVVQPTTFNSDEYKEIAKIYQGIDKGDPIENLEGLLADYITSETQRHFFYVLVMHLYYHKVPQFVDQMRRELFGPDICHAFDTDAFRSMKLVLYPTINKHFKKKQENGDESQPEEFDLSEVDMERAPPDKLTKCIMRVKSMILTTEEEIKECDKKKIKHEMNIKKCDEGLEDLRKGIFERGYERNVRKISQKAFGSAITSLVLTEELFNDFESQTLDTPKDVVYATFQKNKNKSINALELERQERKKKRELARAKKAEAAAETAARAAAEADAIEKSLAADAASSDSDVSSFEPTPKSKGKVLTKKRSVASPGTSKQQSNKRRKLESVPNDETDSDADESTEKSQNKASQKISKKDKKKKKKKSKKNKRGGRSKRSNERVEDNGSETEVMED